MATNCFDCYHGVVNVNSVYIAHIYAAYSVRFRLCCTIAEIILVIFGLLVPSRVTPLICLTDELCFDGL